MIFDLIWSRADLSALCYAATCPSRISFLAMRMVWVGGDEVPLSITVIDLRFTITLMEIRWDSFLRLPAAHAGSCP